MSKIAKGIINNEERRRVMGSLIGIMDENYKLTKEDGYKLGDMMRKSDYEDGMEYGESIGVEKGITQTIQSMLRNNATYDFISKVTGKSKKEIEEIRKYTDKIN